MHVQPGSSHRRGVLTVAEHARLRSAARIGSLVATRTHRRAAEVLDARLDALGALERHGYVHVGERAWLDEVRATDPTLGYADWVRRTLAGLGLHWAPSDPRAEPAAGAWADGLRVWSAVLDAPALRLAHVDHPGFEPPDDEFEVRVAGSADGPFPAHLVTAFEALHDLEYTLATLHRPDGYAPDAPVGIEATNAVEPGRWSLLAISEHGADLAYAVEPSAPPGA